MLPIYSSNQLKNWDQHTILQQNIASIDLMERAASQFVRWFINEFSNTYHVLIFCGNGNNGGDGLAIARMLLTKSYAVTIVIIKLSESDSQDFATNFKRLSIPETSIFYSESQVIGFLQGKKDVVLIDCILGYGTNRPVGDFLMNWFQIISNTPCKRISLDLPSGMFVSEYSNRHVIADFTFTFQNPKLCHLIYDTGRYCGKLVIGNIDLATDFVASNPPAYSYTDLKDIKSIFKPRNSFDWKNKFGHSLVIGGKNGMAGAILLAANAALRSGCGLCSILSISENRCILQVRLPEAILTDTKLENWDSYTVILIGPGMGQENYFEEKLYYILNNIRKPIVIDADALSIIAHRKWHDLLHSNCIITPHVGEFDRLFGKSENGFERLNKAIEMAAKYKIHIILKGKYTSVIAPDGNVYFNSTGNSGLAKGGSGDVLSGMLVSFLAQGYSCKEASIFAVYIHGLAADLLQQKIATECILPGDIIEMISQAFQFIKS
jgi:ADP-dependent NAD(P)H-hydrate dehydratase / NAD(P)H-hydrate epimerase